MTLKQEASKDNFDIHKQRDLAASTNNDVHKDVPFKLGSNRTTVSHILPSIQLKDDEMQSEKSSSQSQN